MDRRTFSISGLALGLPYSAEPLLVGAASDLVRAFGELGTLHRKRTGVEVQCTFTGSGTLVRQVQRGAPYHVVAVASEKFALDLERDKYAFAGSSQVFAIGNLVVWTKRTDIQIRRLADLQSPSVQKIAIATPETAPYGMAAKQALERSGLWKLLEPRIVYGENVGVVQRYVETGQADAGFLSLSQALGNGQHLLVPPRLHDPLRQAVCIPVSNPNPAEAQRFCNLLTSKDGREVLKRYGFGLPPIGKA